MRVLYIIPSPISDANTDDIPDSSRQIITSLRCFIVERTRTARRFLRALERDFPIDDSVFFEIDKHADTGDRSAYIGAFDLDRNVGLLSEAGVPGVADPGSAVVDEARRRGFEIKPLSGPSAIFMALSASGLNGQSFCFHGYLPVKKEALKKKLKEIEKHKGLTGFTHLFIETPFRNQSLLNAICDTLDPECRLVIASDLSGSNEKIESKTVEEWKEVTLMKVPSVFLLGN